MARPDNTTSINGEETEQRDLPSIPVSGSDGRVPVQLLEHLVDL